MSSKNFGRVCMGMVSGGECSGDCCGPLIMDAQFFADVKHRARPGVERTHLKGSLFLYRVGEHDCPFLRLQSRRCKIYSKRPMICRKFGDESSELMCCPHIDKDGRIRSEKLLVDFAVLRESLLRSI